MAGSGGPSQTAFIEPGSPWENGHCESFNGKFRDQFLNGEIFYSLKEAIILIERWRRHDNPVSASKQPGTQVTCAACEASRHGEKLHEGLASERTPMISI